MRFFLPLLFAAVASGQNANLSGLITDPSGSAVPHASVTISGQETGTKRETRSNETGLYNAPSLEPGPYTVTVQAAGFQAASQTDLKLEVAQNARVDFRLQVGTAEQKVTVVADAAMINTTDASVSTVVDQNFVKNIPLNGRSFQTLIQLTPGVVTAPVNQAADMGQFSVNGQRTDSNYVTVDGVSANFGASNANNITNSSGGAVPATNVNGGFSGLISVDAMQEFRIQTSTYAPEYGRQPGGQIQIVSRSGTNQLHGAAFDYFRNTALNATDWFENANNLGKAAMRQNDFGGVLGGPIIKNRTFLFLSYEGARLAVPQSAVTAVPSLYARTVATSALSPLLNMFPLPNRNGFFGPDPYTSGFASSWSNRTNFDAGSIRIDQMIGKGMTIFGRFNDSPSNTSYRQGSVVGEPNNIETDTHNILTGTAGLTWIVSPRETNEFRLNYSRDHASGIITIDNFGGATVPPEQYLVPYGNYNFQNGGEFTLSIYPLVQDGAYLQAGRQVINVSQQYNAIDNHTIVHGPHTIKFGLDFRRNALHYSPPHYLTEPFFTDFGPEAGGVLSGQPSFFSSFQARDATLNSADLALYVQDDWKVNRRLTATYGLRYDLELPFWLSGGLYFPVVTGLNPITTAALTKAPFATNYKTFAPRVGLAYQLFQKPGRELVLRGGFGVFYDLLDQNTGSMLWGYGGYPVGAVLYTNGGTFPFTPAEYTPPPIAYNPTTCCNGLFQPNIRQPRTYQWNVSVQQSLGANQALTVSYVGAAGRNLALVESAINPNVTFGYINLVTSAGRSNYAALQTQFQRRLNHGLQVLGSYSWSHCLDDGSMVGGFNSNGSDFSNPGAGNSNYGSCDYDIRHTFSGAVTYEVPKYQGGAFASTLLNQWAVDNIFLVHTAPPVDPGINVKLVGLYRGYQRPDLVPGQPLYLHGAACAVQNGGIPCPAGMGINEAAFSFSPNGQQGDLGRNALRGFGASQWDIALRREFQLSEQFRLQFRAEAFNLLNHPNFGPPQVTLSAPPAPQYPSHWGVAQQMLNQASAGGSGAVNPLYQIGGPRSLQVALKLVF